MYGLWHDQENADEQRVAPSDTDPPPVDPRRSPYFDPLTPTVHTCASCILSRASCHFTPILGDDNGVFFLADETAVVLF